MSDALVEVVEVLPDGNAKVRVVRMLPAVGERVVLAYPDNRKHPRRGKVGTVESVRDFPAVLYRDGKVRTPARRLCWVRFAPAGDAFDAAPGPWGVYDTELRAARP